MITRCAPAGAVCFGCRLRLFRQLTPVRYLTSDAISPPSADDGADNRTNNQTDDRPGGEDAVRNAGSKPKSEPGSEPQLEVRRHGIKKHLSNNRLLEQTSVSLGSKILGKPAYAIVMKDGGMLRKREESLAPSEDATESPGNLATSIEALLDHQREPPTVSEGRSNIQDLRPKTEKVLSEKDFRKLQGLLADGFLGAQLRDYIQWHKDKSRPESPKAPMSSLDPPEPPEPPEFGWIEEISPWVPLQTQPNDAKGTDLTLQGYVSATTQPKEKLAIRLMRECWGLSIAELQTQLGETRVKLRTNEFLLLMRGTQRFVGGLGKIWLEPGEKIEAIRSQRTLRLVTARHKAESLIDNLHKTLRSVATKTFPVRLVASEVPDANVLEELGRITNTHIRVSHTNRRLHVDWIELESRADLRLKTLEDLGHIVFRLLLTALQPRQATSDLLSPTVSQTNPGRLIVDTTNKDKLPWKDRLAQWARFVYPLAPEESAANLQLPIQKLELPFEPLKQTEVSNEDQPSKAQESTENPTHGLLFFEPPTGTLEAFRVNIRSPDPKFPIKWSGVLQTSTVAHFGQVLHSYQPSNPTPFLSDLLSSTDRRLFTPTIPHPLHLARFGPTYSDISKSEVTTKSTLVLRFWPSPSTASPSKKRDHPAADTPLAPVLELRLAVSDQGVKGVESLRAISRTHHTDVMLPSSLVDMRFTQTQYETLEAPDTETLAAWQPLVDFLGRAHLDLANGKLEMPPRQTFTVPRRLFGRRPLPPLPTPWSGARRTTRARARVLEEQRHQLEVKTLHFLSNVSYEFVGLELHRHASVPYDGHQLTYTSIEAGQGGGRRAEVTLEPLEAPPTPDPVDAVFEIPGEKNHILQENFLACCSRFAADHSIWSGLNGRKPKV